MAQQVYPVLVVVDDDGTIVSGATVTVASVTDTAGSAIASHGATVSAAGANVCVNYDATAKGDAWVTLAVSKLGSTFSGLAASPRAYLTADSQQIAAIRTVTDAITVAKVDGGIVSASPTPTTTVFSATGDYLRSAAGGYVGMAVRFTSGPNDGTERAVTVHAIVGSRHDFTVEALPVAPAATNTFIIV